jgi:hypothetical protein
MNSRKRFFSTTRSRSSSAPNAMRDEVTDERSGGSAGVVAASRVSVTAVIREAPCQSG